MVQSAHLARMSSTGNTFVIRHREFVQDIIEPASNSGAFTLRSLSINAGNPILFPWLSNVAALFDQYRIKAMVFHFKPTSSMINNAAGAGIGMGVCVMMTDYDSADGAPSSKQQMEAYQFATSCAPYEEMIHPIECKRSQTTIPVLYVRTLEVPTGKDIRFYDLGKTYLATIGIPNNTSTQTIGELWVSYELELLKPILNDSQPSPTTTPVGLTFSYLIANVSTASLFGLSVGQTLDGASFGNPIPGLTITWNLTAVNRLTFSNGTNYALVLMVQYVCLGASTALTNAMTATLGGTATNHPIVGSVGQFGVVAGTTSLTQFNIVYMNIPANSTGSITYNTTQTLPGTATAASTTVALFT